MATVPNTLIYREEWVTKIQERLDQPTIWKDVCRVEYTNTRVINNPYLADITVQSGYNRGSPYTYQTLTETNQTATISTRRDAPIFVDRADFAQSDFLKQMDWADYLGVLMNESIETYVWSRALTAPFELFDGADIGGTAGSITVSITNVDNVVRNIRRLIYARAGGDLLARNGGYIVWWPADFEVLESFAQANGFNTADNVLTSGVKNGFHYMGFDHYVSNLLPSGAGVAGVKKVLHLGILKDTYGSLMVDDKDPAQMSGIGFNLRTDLVLQNWFNTRSMSFVVATAAT